MSSTSSTRLVRALLTVAALWWASVLGSAGWRVLRGDGRDADWLFAGIAAAAVGAAALALRTRTQDAGRIALALFSSMATLLLLDAGVAFVLHIHPPARDHATLALREGIPFDPRSKLEVIDELRASGRDAVPHAHPCNVLRNLRTTGRLDLIPLAGISNATTVYGNETGTHLVYESDRYGFNNARDLWAKGRARVALVGDSFTAGAYVDPNENVAGWLDRTGVATINLGVGCTGPLTHLGRLREYAAALEPEVIVWLHYEGNDLRELEFEKSFDELQRYLQPGYTQKLRSRQSQIDQLLRVHAAQKEERARRREAREERSAAGFANSLPARTLRLAHLRALSRHAREYREGTFFEWGQENPDLELFQQILDQANQTVATWNGKLLFVYLPSFHRFEPGVDADAFHDRARVLERVRALGVPIVDVSTAMGPDPQAYFALRTAGHYGSDGYALVAEEIRRALH